MNKLKIFCAFAAGMLAIAACNKPVLFDERLGQDSSINTGTKKKVLVIAIEGARGQVVKDADMPHLKSLLEHSIYSWDAVSDTLSKDAASWAGLFTGVTNLKNAVKESFYRGHNLQAFPSFLQRLATNATLDIVSVSSSASLNDTLLKSGSANTWVNTAGNDVQARDSAVKRLQSGSPDVMVVAFNGVQRAGVAGGFSAATGTYMDALKAVDGYVGDVLNAMRSRRDFAREDWLVVVTSNHGGLETGAYGGASFNERNIFLLYHHPSFVSRQVEMPLVNVPYDGKYAFFNRENGADKAAYTNDPIFKVGADQNFTIEFNILTQLNSGADHPVIANKNWGSGGNTGWVIYKQNGNLRLNFKGAGTGRIDVRNGPPVADGKWHHITVTFNRQGTVDFYMDGKFFVSGGSIANKGNLDTGLPLAIGSDGTLNYGYNGANTSGENYIADVRVWNTVLPAATIEAWAFRTVTNQHPSYASLIGYWKANEQPAGNTIKDYSPSGVDLVIQNSPRWDARTEVLNPSSIDATLLVPRAMDLTSNVLAWMGVKMKPDWGLDGKVEIVE
ncbi:LamG-like jellyroll fold domain-containing protein [Chitinophaga rhizosphaerae]|uniref:LamG-like jellyroll fold domain-containing protein n=1 Tax=Chitinophaga rhizosphaerae TaxID=1864947 RepID=UPI000F7FADE8|nr:LamG-like jellyroll fold domain-containing protein [Chitinophaga rhizosphaerae]